MKKKNYIDPLLNTRHCTRHWKYSQQDRNGPFPDGGDSLAGEIDVYI